MWENEIFQLEYCTLLMSVYYSMRTVRMRYSYLHKLILKLVFRSRFVCYPCQQWTTRIYCVIACLTIFKLEMDLVLLGRACRSKSIDLNRVRNENSTTTFHSTRNVLRKYVEFFDFTGTWYIRTNIYDWVKRYRITDRHRMNFHDNKTIFLSIVFTDSFPYFVFRNFVFVYDWRETHPSTHHTHHDTCNGFWFFFFFFCELVALYIYISIHLSQKFKSRNKCFFFPCCRRNASNMQNAFSATSIPEDRRRGAGLAERT